MVPNSSENIFALILGLTDEYFQETLNMIEPARKLAAKIPDVHTTYWTSKLLSKIKSEQESEVNILKVTFLALVDILNGRRKLNF